MIFAYYTFLGLAYLIFLFTVYVFYEYHGNADLKTWIELHRLPYFDSILKGVDNQFLQLSHVRFEVYLISWALLAFLISIALYFLGNRDMKNLGNKVFVCLLLAFMFIAPFYLTTLLTTNYVYTRDAVAYQNFLERKAQFNEIKAEAEKEYWSQNVKATLPPISWPEAQKLINECKAVKVDAYQGPCQGPRYSIELHNGSIIEIQSKLKLEDFIKEANTLTVPLESSCGPIKPIIYRKAPCDEI